VSLPIVEFVIVDLKKSASDNQQSTIISLLCAACACGNDGRIS
jgi:hypothetical protein